MSSVVALSPALRFVRFCDCQVDLCTGEVHRDGSRVALQRQPFKVLSALLERPGDLVTRAELQQRICPDEVHLDFEHSLNRSVNKLRIALGDSAEKPRIIETLPCRGYRFIAPLATERTIRSPGPQPVASSEPWQRPAPPRAIAPHGALCADSPFYIVRSFESRVHDAIAAHESVVLLKGARETGKTSLLARVIDRARRSGIRVVVTDLQKFNSGDLASIDGFLCTLTHLISETLQLAPQSQERWKPGRGASWNFEQFMSTDVLAGLDSLLWIIDEADRLFTFPWAGEFFGLLRAWHNKRALDGSATWHKLTVAIAYAAEAQLLITDWQQSPFNLGSRFVVPDFSRAEIAELSRRYDLSLESSEIEQVEYLLGGHPHLTHSAMFSMANDGFTIAELVERATSEDGPFGDHLWAMLVYLERSPELLNSIRGLLKGEPSISTDCFYRLRASGIIRGGRACDVNLRCRLYHHYLTRHLSTSVR